MSVSIHISRNNVVTVVTRENDSTEPELVADSSRGLWGQVDFLLGFELSVTEFNRVTEYMSGEQWGDESDALEWSEAIEAMTNIFWDEGDAFRL